MDLRNLNTFIQVAESKSFTRAATALGYSQPTVSLQIKQLEDELGVRLFDRIGHTVSLTEGGKEALSYAQQICRLSQEMSSSTNQPCKPKGIIRVAMADSLCTPLIAREFARFRKEHPYISLSVTTAGTEELFRLLDHNEVDIVCTLDSHIYNSAYVVCDEEKIDAHFVCCAKSSIANADSISVESLLKQPFLLTEKGMSYRRLLDERLARDSIELQPVLEIGSADLICRLVTEGTGISFLPDYVTEDAIKSKNIVRLPVDDCKLDLWKQIICRKDKWVSFQMQAVIDFLSKIKLK